MAKRTEYSKYNKYFPKNLPKKVKDYATNVALNFSRYIVTNGNHGYCTACNKDINTSLLETNNHNEYTTCPNCRHSCKIKKQGWFSKYQYDEAYFTYFEKARKNADAIIGYFIYCYRDYRYGYKNIRTEIILSRKYYFAVGKAVMFEKSYWSNDYYKASSVYFGTQSNVTCITNYQTLKQCVMSTPFKYMKHWISDSKEKLASYAQKPIIEILCKTGFGEIADDIHSKRKTYHTLNWRANNICDFLKLSKQDFKILREKHIDIRGLKLIQVFNKKNEKWRNLDINNIINIFEDNYDDALFIISRKEIRLAKLIAYYDFYHQDDYADDSGGYYKGYGFFRDWKDYINDCLYLDLDLNNKKTAYPDDLHKAHEEILKHIKIKNDEIKNKKMQKRAKDLEKYIFEYGDFIIRPPHNVKELIVESDKLGHCVKRYADKHIACHTNLMFLRKKDKPNKPFYTLEFSNEKNLVQCRRKGNKSYTDDELIIKVVDEFIKTKLNKKKKRKVS